MVLESTGRMKIREGNFQYSKKSFRAPFKVYCMAISPVNDIIAIGSRTGDITLKRASWKQVWKFNISQTAQLARNGMKVQLDCLEFSPDGEILAAATTDGHINVIDVESGRFKHYARVVADTACPPSFLRIRWCLHNKIEHIESGVGRFLNEVELEVEADMKATVKKFEDNKATLYDQCIDMTGTKPDVAKEDVAFVFQMLEEDSSFIKAEDGMEEAIENTFISNRKFRQSYKDTILLAVRDDMIISVLLAGVYPFADIDIKKYFGPMNLEPIFIYDAFYSRSSGGISIIATSCGPRPKLDRTKNFGKPIMEEAGEPGVHTHVINFKLAIQEIHWELALRFIRLVYGFFLLYISFETCRKNWDTQVQILHNRFDTKIPNVRIGEILIDMMLSGSTEPAGEQFLERGMGIEGLAGVNEFIEKHLIEVGRIARGQIVTAVRNLSFQVVEFVMAVNRIADKERIDIHTDELLTKRFDDPEMDKEAIRKCNNNPAVMRLEQEASRIEMKMKQLQLSCIVMIQELSHLTKWMGMLKPFARGIKANMLLRSKRMEIKQLMSYIVNTFITDQNQKDQYRLVMFRIEDLVEKINAHDLLNNFDELKFFEDAKNDAEQLHTVYKEELKTFRPDMDEYNNKQEEMMLNSASDMKKGQQADKSRPQPTGHECFINMDRIGPFFHGELTTRANETASYLNPLLLGIDQDNQEKDEQEMQYVRNLGFAKVIEHMAEAVQGVRRAVDTPPKTEKSNFAIQWLFEVDSGKTHTGFQNCRISTLYHESSVMDTAFKSREPLRRALHVICSSEKQFSSNFIVTPCDWEYDGVSREVGPIREFSKVYNFETDDKPTVEDSDPKTDDKMEVDENELSVDTDNREVHKFNSFTGFDQVYSVFDGEMIILANFANGEGGVSRRMLKFESDNANQNNWIVQNDSWGTTEIVESAAVCQYMRRGIYSHDEGTRVAIFYYEPHRENRLKQMAAPVEQSEANDEQGTSDGTRTETTFREFQARRERLRKMIPAQYAQVNQFDDLIEEFIDTNAPEDELENMFIRRP